MIKSSGILINHANFQDQDLVCQNVQGRDLWIYIFMGFLAISYY